MSEFFKQVDGKMYLSFNTAVECGIGSDKYLRFAKSAGRKTIQFIDDPDDLRRSLVNYDTLKGKHKELVHSWLRKKSGCKHSDGADCNCGNPYHYMTTEPVRAMIKPDLVAEAFFLEYRYTGPTGNDSLPHETIERYGLAAGILKLIADAEKDKKSLIKERFKTDVLGFYEIVGGIITELKAQDKLPRNFPSDYAKLRRRVVLFNQKGYESLIDPRFGNKSAAKINDELSEAMLLELIAHPNQYDDKLVAIIYNEWAEGQKYKAIDRGTVQVWRKKREFEVMTDREGREVYNNKLRRKVLRQRPSQPTYLWESDDNHLDWLFQGDKANEYRKVKGIIVTDSFNDYVLGWAITDGEMPGDIVRMAYLNAMYHIYELTGGWYLPFEVKTDQWNISQLRPFYQKLGHYYDTPVGSKNRGWLENLFGHVDWERSLKLGNNNYTGHNITARTRGVNMEVVKAEKKVWPHISEAADQMATLVNRLRTMPQLR
jgi:hypothetical protein